MEKQKKTSGNEVPVTRYLFSQLEKISLNHLGIIKSVGTPVEGASGYYLVNSLDDIRRVKTPNNNKKADIYLNGFGVSVKQKGSSFSFNRLQRAEAEDLFNQLGIKNVSSKLVLLDKEVKAFHEGGLPTRSRPWESFFEESAFKLLLKYLMMTGSPNKGISEHPAQYILEAQERIGFSLVNMSTKKTWDIDVFTFDEYFEKYKKSLKIGIRRSWYGQVSKSEHSRAAGLLRKHGNDPWVFNEVSGKPRNGWRKEVHPDDRKTVYFLMIEKIVER